MTDPTERLAAVLSALRAGECYDVADLDREVALMRVRSLHGADPMADARTLLAELGLVAVPRELVEAYRGACLDARSDRSPETGEWHSARVAHHAIALADAVLAAVAEQAKP